MKEGRASVPRNAVRSKPRARRTHSSVRLLKPAQLSESWPSRPFPLRELQEDASRQQRPRCCEGRATPSLQKAASARTHREVTRPPPPNGDVILLVVAKE